TTPGLPGRVVSLAVKPGQRVEAGDVLAEVHSGELEALRLELLSAKTESGLSGKILQALQDAPEAVPGQQILDAQTRHRQNLNTLQIAKSKWLSLGLSPESLDDLLREGRPGPGAATLPVRSP